jgi:hypothetical protein
MFLALSQQDLLGINETAAAANTIWETAKRLITALAAVGVVLTAGSQFASLGKINSIFFFLIAIAGVIGGFSGVEIVLWYIVRASTPEYLTLSKLIELDSIV